MKFVYKKSDLNFLKYKLSISLKAKNKNKKNEKKNKRKYLLKVKKDTFQGICKDRKRFSLFDKNCFNFINK